MIHFKSHINFSHFLITLLILILILYTFTIFFFKSIQYWDNFSYKTWLSFNHHRNSKSWPKVQNFYHFSIQWFCHNFLNNFFDSKLFHLFEDKIFNLYFDRNPKELDKFLHSSMRNSWKQLTWCAVGSMILTSAWPSLAIPQVQCTLVVRIIS